MSITWFDVLAVIFALGLAALGIWRGFLREILVSLGGIILGVFAGTLWTTSWGEEWAVRLGMDTPVFKGVLGLVSLYLIVLIIGYGSALFLRSRPISIWKHLAGGGIGLLNGLFLAAFTFNYIQNYFLGGEAASEVMKSLIASRMVTWLPVILGGVVLAVILAVVGVAIVRLVRFISRLVQSPAPLPMPVDAVSPPAEPTDFPPPPPPPPPPPTVPCPNCGDSVPADAGFCPQCGKILS